MGLGNYEEWQGPKPQMGEVWAWTKDSEFEIVGLREDAFKIKSFLDDSEAWIQFRGALDSWRKVRDSDRPKVGEVWSFNKDNRYEITDVDEHSFRWRNLKTDREGYYRFDNDWQEKWSRVSGQWPKVGEIWVWNNERNYIITNVESEFFRWRNLATGAEGAYYFEDNWEEDWKLKSDSQEVPEIDTIETIEI